MKQTISLVVALLSLTRVTAQDLPSPTTETLFPGFFPTVTPQSGCPVVTETGILCSTCAVPQCIEFSTVTQVCGCPTPVATVYLNFPCGDDTACAGAGCTTDFQVEELQTTCEASGSSESTATESTASETASSGGESSADTTLSVTVTTTGAPETSSSSIETPESTTAPETTPGPSANGSVPVAPSGGPTTIEENGAGRMRVPLLGWW